MENSSLIKVFDDNGKLVGLARTDKTAADTPLTQFESEVWRIFNENEKLKKALARKGLTWEKMTRRV